MTDGELVKEARRIYRYLVKIEELPDTSYSEARKAEHKAKFEAIVVELISMVERSTHAQAAQIVSIIRANIKAKKINSIHAGIRPCLEFPRNWVVKKHELEYVDS